MTVVVNTGQIPVILLVGAGYDAFVFVVQSRGYSTLSSVSNRFAINAKYWSDLGSGASEKGFITRVEFSSANGSFHESQVKIMN